MNFADLRSKYPGYADDEIIGALQATKYPDYSADEIKAATGYKPPTTAQQFTSGLKRSFQEVPGIAAGAAAYGADVVGATETRDNLLSYAKRKGDEVSQQHANDASSLTDTWDGKTSWGDFLANSAGYVVGQAAQAIITGGLGGISAKMLATAGVREAAEAAAAKAIAAGATEAGAKAIAAKTLEDAATKAFGRGAVAGAGTQNFGMELGSIYPDAVKQAADENRTMDGGDKLRVLGSAAAAAAVDTAAEVINAKNIFRGSAASGGLMARAAREVPIGMAREAGTEGVQTAIEHYGAGQPIADAKGLRDIVDSMGVGAVGGGLAGGGAALRSRNQEAAPQPAQDPAAAAEAAAADAALERITTATTADEAIQAFTESYKSPEPPPLPAGLDAEGAIARMEQQSADGYKAAKVAARQPGYGDVVPSLMDRAAGVSTTGSTPLAEPGIAEVPTEPFSDRLLTVREQLEDSRVRQQVRDTLGPDALNDIMYYAQRADDASLPGKTSDNMLATAEGILTRAQVQPLPRQQAMAEKAAAKAEKLAANPAPLQIPLDTTPTGAIRVDSQGQAAPEIRADQISLADRARAMQRQRTDGLTAQTPRGGEPGAGVMVGDGALTTAQFPERAQPVSNADELRLLPGPSPVDIAAHAAAPSPENDRPEPTQAQKEAGNYKVGRVSIGGLNISVENPQGSERSGVDRDGKAWTNTLNHHYGYIRGTVGMDGEHIDTFIKPGTQPDNAGTVFVIDQIHPDTGKYDEHKVMIGFDTLEEAKDAYRSNYAPGWKGLKTISATPMAEFKQWLAAGDTSKPFNPAPTLAERAQSMATPRTQPGATDGTTSAPAGQPDANGVAASPDVAGSGSPAQRVAADAGRGNAQPAAEPVSGVRADSPVRAGGADDAVAGLKLGDPITGTISTGAVVRGQYVGKTPDGRVKLRQSAGNVHYVAPEAITTDGQDAQAGADPTAAAAPQAADARGDSPAPAGAKPAGLPAAGGAAVQADGVTALAIGPNESDQDRSNRQWRENYAKVTGEPDLTKLSARELESAVGYGSRVVAGEKRKGWDGGKVNSDLVRSAEADLYAIDQELRRRGVIGQPDLPKAPAAAATAKATRSARLGEFDAAPVGATLTFNGKTFTKRTGATWAEDKPGAQSLVSSFFVDRGHTELISPPVAPNAETAVQAGSGSAAVDPDGLTWRGKPASRDTLLTLRGSLEAKVAAHEAEIDRATKGKQTGDSKVVRDLRAAADASRQTLNEVDAALDAEPQVLRTKRRTKAEIEHAATEAARADYFTPGNIVKSYSGLDRVVSYTAPAEPGGAWSVKVQRVVKQGDEYTPAKEGGRDAEVRSHSTQPDTRELKTGLVRRAPAATNTGAPVAFAPHADLHVSMQSSGWTAEVDSPSNTIWTKRIGKEKYTARLTPSAPGKLGRMEVTVPVDGIGTQLDEFGVDDARAAATAASNVAASDSGVTAPTPNATTTPDTDAPIVSANTIFTEDAAEKARAILRKKLGGTLNSGIDPELLQAGITLAGYHIERGARTFAAYAQAMVGDLGDAIRPYLKSLYMAVKFDPRAAAFEGMSTSAEVETASIDAQPTSKDAPNAIPALDERSPGPLGRVSAETIRGTGEKRGAGQGAARGSERDGAGNGHPDRSGRAGARSMGAGARDVPVPATRTRRGAESGTLGGLFDGPSTAQDDAGLQRPVTPPEFARKDFRITADTRLGEGGQKTKFKQNVAAIRLLNELETTGRNATVDEQNALARYVGWGGLPQAFDSKKEDWAKEHAELKALLTPEEYAAALESTQYAHYTSEPIVTGMFDALQRLGFKGGKTLEPGAGVGNFVGLMPDALKTGSRVTMVERERIAAGIAKRLYPEQNVQLADFTAFKGADGYFDAAIGNPPFSSTPLTDVSGRKHLSRLSVHNYFFAKAVDLLRPGGVLAQVVSNSFMDAAGDRARQYIGDRTRLLGAIRLPNNAFSKNANTEVTTDIVFLQKLPDAEWGTKETRTASAAWMDLGTLPDPAGGEAIPLNRYFVDHPEMMLGRMERTGTMYRADQPALKAADGQDTAALMKAAIARLPENIYVDPAVAGTEQMVDGLLQRMKDVDVEVGGFFHRSGKLFERVSDEAGESLVQEMTPSMKWTEKTTLGEARFDRLRRLADLRNTMRALLAAEMAGENPKVLRQALNDDYDAYVKEHGFINDNATIQVYGEDPDFPLLASLETDYKRGISADAARKQGIAAFKSTAKKMPIFSRPVIEARKRVESAKTPADALAVSMAERGKIDADYMSTLLGREADGILRDLSEGAEPLLFKDPASNEYVLRDAYLSGNVRKKLEQAKAASMVGNVRALQDVQPEDVGTHEISVRIGSPWVPPQFYEDFAQHLFGEGTKARVTYLPMTSGFMTTIKAASDVANNNTYGTKAMDGTAIFDSLLNNRSIKVTYRDSEGKVFTDVPGTEAANLKATDIKEKFGDWVFKDSERAEALGRAYNDENNNYVTRKYDGKMMTFPGKVPDEIINFRRHQRNAIARIVQDRTVLLDHVVGSGKTFSVVAGAMELKRTGLARKPMVTVPNHLVKQWAADWYRLYPGANILAATKKDFEKGNRRRFLARIATGDWDGVIIAHSSFGFIQPEPEFEIAFNEKQIGDIMSTIGLVQNEGDAKDSTTKRRVKQLAKMKEALEQRIKALRDRPMDNLLDFGQLGVDQLFVDEAHLYKNLMYSTKMQNVQGLGDGSGSQRAYDMYVKAGQIFQRNGRGQGVVFATGTPISNSLAEMYHMMRYLMPAQMQELGFQSFDAWANTYASVDQVWMQKISGDGFKASNRMATFVNTPELLKLLDQVADTVTMRDIKAAYSEENNGAEFPLPKVKGGRRTPVSLPKSAAQEAFMETIAARAKALEAKKGPPQKGDDNALVIMTDARKAAMDVRLVAQNFGEGHGFDLNRREPGARIDRASDEVVSRYHQYDGVKGAQLVFSDLGTPLKQAKAELKEYEALKARADLLDDADLSANAQLGDKAASAKLDDAQVAADELDAKGSDWLGAVQSALRGFSVYDDFRNALIEKGIPEREIAFIHDYNTDDQKAALFRKVNTGQIRVLLGSTAKLGAGTNVQERLVALHHLDVPWKPSDVEQREGRIERQGNQLMAEVPKFEVEILAYVTRDTLDMRMWQLQEAKLKMINQLRERKVGREVDNAFQDMEMSAGEMQAAATGNMDLLTEIKLKNDVKQLEQRQRAFDSQKSDLARRRRNAERVIEQAPKKIEQWQPWVKAWADYRETMQEDAPVDVAINGKDFTSRAEAQTELRSLVDAHEARIAARDAAIQAAIDEGLAKYPDKEDGAQAAARMSNLEAAKKANPMPKLAIEFNGKTYGSKTAVAEAFTDAAGDASRFDWTFGGKNYIHRAKLIAAITDPVMEALDTDTVREIGTFGPFKVSVEGQSTKMGTKRLDVIVEHGSKVISDDVTASRLSETEDAGRKNAGAVIEKAQRLLSTAENNVFFAQEDLRRGKKALADLGEAKDAGEWPGGDDLERARAAHKEVVKRLAAVQPEKAAAETLNTRSLEGRRFFANTKYAQGRATLIRAKTDAEEVLGVKVPVRVATEARLDRLDMPMRYDLDNKTVWYNTAVQHDPSSDVQYMLEELLHAVDHIDGDRTISAGNPRFLLGGDIRSEIEQAMKGSAAMRDLFTYPLDEDGYTDTQKAAELFARIGVLYHGRPALLKITAPNTYAAYEQAFGLPGRRQGVQGEIRQLPGDGLAQGRAQPAEVGGGSRGGQRVDPGNAERDQLGQADGLQRLRENARRALGGATDGAPVEFGRSDASLETRSGAQPTIAERAIGAMTATSVREAARKAGNKWADYRSLGLQALGRRQLVELYEGDIPAMTRYSALVDQMDADNNQAGAEADTLAVAWGKLSDEEALANLMHDATVAHIDPTKSLVAGDAALQHAALKMRFAALSADAKKTFLAARDMYQAHWEKVQAEIRARIERSMPDNKRRAEMLSQMDAEFFGRVKGVYFPLTRFGDYVIVAKDSAGNVMSVTRAETMNEAEAARRGMLAQFAGQDGVKVGKVLRAREFNASRDMVSKGFIKELFDTLETQNAPDDLFDSINQLYLESLPDLSWAKHGIHRKGTPGFSQDARRAFAQHMFHGARYLSKLRYSDQLTDGLEAMQSQVDKRAGDDGYNQPRAQNVVDEMVKRHDSLMNPKTNALSTALTSFGFVFHLGLSPASALANLSQTALVAFPVMGAKWGFGKASAALLVASKQAAGNRNDISKVLNGDDLAAYNEAVNAGVIDVTNAHDLAGISQGEDSRVALAMRPVMKWASFMFHHAERFNRQVTFVAAYRLAREAGAKHADAYDQAVKATYDGHFNYSASNRPRIMQGNAAKVLLLFKQFGQNMIYTLMRQAQQAIKGETPQARAEARKALAGLLVMHAAGAGVLGLPLVTTLLAAASMIGGSDDDPWDAQTALRNMLADTFGQKPAEVLAHGLSRLTPWDMSGRVGLNSMLLPDIQEGLEGQRLGESALTAFAGPVAGIGISALKGLQSISEGKWALGLETMMPAALRGPMRAHRYGTEGAIDKTGIPIKEEVGAAGVAGQAFGLSPAEVREAQEARGAIYQADHRLMDRRKTLLAHFAMAQMAGDTEGASDARKSVMAFNHQNPERAINNAQLMQSVMRRMRRINDSEDGVYLPQKRRNVVERGRFATAEE